MTVQIGELKMKLSDINHISEVLVPTTKVFDDSNDGWNLPKSQDERDWRHRFMINYNIYVTVNDLRTTENGLKEVRDRLYSLWFTYTNKLVIIA